MTQYAEYGFRGKTAIVTGGGTGIGASVAVELAKGGANVAIFGRRSEPVERTKEICLKYADKVLGMSVDVSNKDSVEEGVGTVLDRFGGVDILVNNAGIELKIDRGRSRFWDFFDTQDTDEYLEFFRVNTLGHYLMNLAVIPGMRKNRFGRIVNVASSLGVSGDYSTPGYTASKGAAITQTKAFARRYGGDNITVNVVLPGMVDTPMKSDSAPEEYETVKRLTPLGRVAQPIDLARVILFFAQEHLFVTGQALIVSGGMDI
ncbi:MAG: SDR family NAD(P)-dependent oxidoreductase [Clostridiales Family XIII bacterium]|jgi:3-oxoacyl-[acyl-carrier protein] reductase|nr:SDR family NAD(P)-dependent oxidoreductase [Clostridiales Family XIII bacterium]